MGAKSIVHHQRSQYPDCLVGRFIFAFCCVVPAAASVGLVASLLLTRMDQDGIFSIRLQGTRSSVTADPWQNVDSVDIWHQRSLRSGRLLIPLDTENTYGRGLESVLPEDYYYDNKANSGVNELPEDQENNTRTIVVVSVILVSIAGTIICCAALMYLLDIFQFDCSRVFVLKRRRQRRRLVWHGLRNKSENENKVGAMKEKKFASEETGRADVECDALFTLEPTDAVPLSRVSSMTNSLVEYDADEEAEQEIDIKRELEQILENGITSPDSNESNEHWVIHLDMSGEYDSTLYKDDGWTETRGDESDDERVSRFRSADIINTDRVQGSVISRDSTCYLSYTADDEQDDQHDRDQLTEREATDYTLEVANNDNCKTRVHAARLTNVNQESNHEERDAAPSQVDDHVEDERIEDSEVLQDPGVPSFELEDYVRDIYFIPRQHQDVENVRMSYSLGIDVLDADGFDSYPCIVSIADSSPVKGRIFDGDFLVAVNDRGTSGLTSQAALDMAHSCFQNVGNTVIAKMIKLTVLSSRVDLEDRSVESLLSDSRRLQESNSAESTVDVLTAPRFKTTDPPRRNQHLSERMEV